MIRKLILKWTNHDGKSNPNVKSGEVNCHKFPKSTNIHKFKRKSPITYMPIYQCILINYDVHDTTAKHHMSGFTNSPILRTGLNKSCGNVSGYNTSLLWAKRGSKRHSTFSNSALSHSYDKYSVVLCSVCRLKQKQRSWQIGTIYRTRPHNRWLTQETNPD